MRLSLLLHNRPTPDTEYARIGAVHDRIHRDPLVTEGYLGDLSQDQRDTFKFWILMHEASPASRHRWSVGGHLVRRRMARS